MNYSKLQKITSLWIIFALLFSITFRVPFFGEFNRASATGKDFYSLISIIVDEDTYDSISSELKRYAQDIQGVLEKTRAVILPVPTDAKQIDISSLNESLYFEGYKGVDDSVDFESRLIGTVLVGDIPTPVISNNNKTVKSIFPYTDFEDKAYAYNHDSGFYEKNNETIGDLKAEVWHGVISPNTGDNGSDIQGLKDYFDKNHDFYEGTGNFTIGDETINGNNSDEISEEYEPFVFYFDQFREEKSLHYPSYKAYETYLENREDIVYNRYTKSLAEKIKELIQEAEGESITELLSRVSPESVEYASDSLGNASDISTRTIIQKAVKKFVETFNAGQIEDLRTNVHNAGRYNTDGSKVNVDFIPYIVSTLDNISDEIIKSASTDLENQIDELVMGGLSRKIALPTSIEETSLEVISMFELGFIDIVGSKKYINFLHGRDASTIDLADQCSIYRGSTENDGNLVESNRGYNLKNIEGDTELCGEGSRNSKGLWGGNSPLNLDVSDSGDMSLGAHDLTLSITPLFDILGSKKTENSSNIISPLKCEDSNFLLASEKEGGLFEGTVYNYKIPEPGDNMGIINGNEVNWCSRENVRGPEGLTFEEVYNSSTSDFGACGRKVMLDNEEIISEDLSSLDSGAGLSCEYNTYSYKRIPSYVFHKSPTTEELSLEISNPVTPNLAVDRDRYVDFIGAAGSYQRINYPYLFRINAGSLEETESLLEEYLNSKSEEINNIINSNSGASGEIYELLKNGELINESFDLLAYLKNKPLQTVQIGGETKEISYYDFLVFSIFWNNMTNTSAKYKFVMEGYLSDQFGGNDYSFLLPKNKKQYEIAYLGAPGDATNMYVKLDPEAKGENPFTDIVSSNSLLDSNLISIKTLSNTNQIDGGGFKCAPPDGVPIWEWIPAVVCWINNMLPPTVGISEGTCGSSFLTEDEIESISNYEEENSCSGDLNQNGVNDCVEHGLESGTLDLSTDMDKYNYDKFGELKVSLKDGTGEDALQVLVDSSSYVDFYLKNITDTETGESIDLDSDKVSDYISFQDANLKLNYGEAKYSFATRSKDAEITFGVKLENEDLGISLEDEINIEISGDNLSIASYSFSEGDLNIGGGSTKAGNSIYIYDESKQAIGEIDSVSDGLVLGVINKSRSGENIDIDFPINVQILDSFGDAQFETDISSLSSFQSLTSLSTSGIYDLVIKDSSGFVVKKEFEILAGDPTSIKIDLGSTILEKGGSITTNIVSILDSFGNPVTGEYYDLDLKLSGSSLEFVENGEDEISYKTFEGFRAFRLKSNENEGLGDISIEFSQDGQTILETTSETIRVVSEINLNISGADNLEVGENSYEITVNVEDNNGNILSDLNSRVYLNISNKYGSTEKPYYELEDGKAIIDFQTGFLAGEDIPFEFQIEGLSRIQQEYFDILPGDALKIDLKSSKSRMEAKQGNSTNIEAELKDAYGNLVFTDNDTSLSLELPEEYDSIITLGSDSQVVSGGKAIFEVNATDNPGTAYVKITSDPDLSLNSLSIEGQSPFSKTSLNLSSFIQNGNLTDLGREFFYEVDSDNIRSKFNKKDDLERALDNSNISSGVKNRVINLWDNNNSFSINGVGENSIKIETYFFWKQENVIANKYNAIYTTLLGAPYGDFTQKDYLAGSLLFNRDNSSLAVTSLINNPYLYSDIVQITSAGSVKKVYNSSDLTQDIEIDLKQDEDNIAYLDLFNASLTTYIGKIFFNFSDNTDLKICEYGECNGDFDSDTIFAEQTLSNYNFELDNSLRITNNLGETLVNIEKNGNIVKHPSVAIELGDYDSKSTIFDIKVSNATIGRIGFYLSGDDIQVVKDSNLLSSVLSNFKSNIVLNLETDDYPVRDILSTEGETIKSIYYLDPFAKKYSLNSFSRENPDSYENFALEEGLGWKGGNKSLLDFSAGKNVGESVRQNASVGVINLGDPVVSLKKIKVKLPGTEDDRKFDRTIGKKLNSEDISSYQVFDYNDDDKDDLLLISQDGFFKLLENKDIHGNTLNQRNLAKVDDLGDKKLVLAGDFTGDGYEDIFFVNNDGNPYLLNNQEKDFTRLDLREQFNLESRIIISRVFDMDDDGLDDIVVLDDSGTITIFYGGGTSGEPSFTSSIVSENQGVNISSESRNDMGAIYFSGLSSGLVNTDPDSDVDVNLINSNIFVELPYDSGNSNNQSSSSDNLIGSILSGFSSDLSGNLDNLGNDIGDLINTYGSGITISGSNYTTNTTFIRSQYSEMAGLKVEKIFGDQNGGSLKSDDIVSVEITLTNELNSTLRDIVYVEDIPDIFILENDDITSSKDLEIKPGIGNYDFLLDSFSLSPNESITINYELKTKPIRYGFIEVGLFEKDEAGDDSYGDIIFKMNEKNCSDTVSIFRSTDPRNYEAGEKEPVCDESKLQLPEELENNNIDEDDNGIPDYIDELLASDDDSISDYAQGVEEELYNDSDGDGIPDLEDDSPNFNSDDLVGDILNIDVDAISEGMDTLVEGFGCGFGGGSCLSLPLNWAPLAPGNDPVVLGRLVGDGLHTFEGIPFFSAVTSVYPFTWPPSSLGAGGKFGYAPGPVRFFYTPTLTGAHGLAVCYGDNVAAGNTPIIGLSPIIPGGNCIVAAYPMNFCSSEEVNGDPTSLGTPSYFSEFGIINGNCSQSSSSTLGSNHIDTGSIGNYVGYQSLSSVSGNSLPNLNQNNYGYNNEALFSMDGGNAGLGEISVDLDLSAIGDGNFKDVIKVNNKRVASFPGFLMDWVTRQVEEIVTKLTDFPTLFVILPDFEGIFSGDWSEYMGEGMSEAYNKGKEDKQKKNDRYDEKIAELVSRKQGLDCNGEDQLICTNIDVEISKIDRQKGFGFEKQYSGIKQAYEFLSNVPFVSVQPETVALNIPWIDKASLNKTLLDWEQTAAQWKQELRDTSDSWTLGGTCADDDEECKTRNKLVVDVNALISSLERNIAILEDYKKFPEKLSSLVNKKQDRLEQITCNIDSISYMTNGWISENGERFKSWVELYVLIKAVLKSWQLLADIFIDFNAECHECKNERYDSIGFLTSLVDFIIPKIPVIQFPKWPDIVLDLHNIRANLNIVIPEFDFNLRPIVLPTLPDLNLPDVPTISFGPLPILPTFEIPELPDLPSLPTIELPNLPPPPKLPKLFASLEGVIDILKLVTKAMCILKKSPFVPEWRAGDQIAFLTERGGYLDFDFLNISLPQFSFPFVDSIEVTTYVNLEFEAEFLVEMARNIGMPLDSFTSNVVNMFDVVPYEIEVEGPDDINIGSLKDKKVQVTLNDFVKLLTANVGVLSERIKSQSKDELTAAQFKELINRELAKPSIAGNPMFDELRQVWATVNNMTYSKEDKLIKDLVETNSDKFDALSLIIEAEKNKNNKLLEKINYLENPKLAENIASIKPDDFEAYNKTLEVYNDKFKLAAKNLVLGEDTQYEELEAMGDVILDTIKPVLSTDLPQDNRLLSVNTQIPSNAQIAALTNNTQSSSGNSCQEANSGNYSYKYEGIYVVENGVSYKLFDYLDELTGKEQLIEIDIDSDTDTDLLYQVGTDLYLKENLNNSPDKQYVSDSPLFISSDDNKFVNGDTYYESVNNFLEISTSINSVNISFKAAARDDLNNYRLEYFDIVDRYLNEDNSSYIPENTKKNIVDAIATDYDSDTYYSIGDDYITGKNLVYIRNASNNLSGVKLHTKQLKNVNDDLNNNSFVSLSPSTKLYSGSSSISIKYLVGEETREVSLDSESYVQFDDTVKVFEISGGSAYVETNENITLNGQEILDNMLQKPLVFGSRLETLETELSDISYIELKYYDGSEFSLDFSEIESYELYDLGYKDTSYLINLDRPNDYYYARIYSFGENIDGTYSRQVLLSPQNESDQTSPDFDFNSSIRIPVYQEKAVDLSDYIYDNSNANLSLSIEGLEESEYSILSGLRVQFGAFDEIFTKDITINITDENENTTSKDIELEVYSPIPQIESYNLENINGSINEALGDEPVNIYRLRSGSIKKLEGQSMTDSEGIFNFPVEQEEGDNNGIINLQIDGETIFTIDEDSGLINILDNYRSSYSVKVLSTDTLNYPEIIVQNNSSGEKIYSGRLRLNSNTNFSIVEDFSYIENNGLYLDIDNGDYSYYKIPNTARYNPGSIVIYRGSNINNEIFVMTPDARIKTSAGYSLRYSDLDGEYVIFDMIRTSGENIGKILFKIENGFVIN